MLIVPEEELLVVEAKVAAQDRDQLHVGQPALLRMSAFNQRTTPELQGEVSVIGADLVEDVRSGFQYYPVRMKLMPREQERLGANVLAPGMPVEVVHSDRLPDSLLVSDEADRGLPGQGFPGRLKSVGQAIAEISIVTDDNDEVELANEFLSHLLMEDTANYLRRGRAFESLSEGELEAEWLKAFRIVFYRDGNPADIVQLDDVAAEMRLRGMQAPDSYLLSEAEKQLISNVFREENLGTPHLEKRAEEFLKAKGRPFN